MKSYFCVFNMPSGRNGGYLEYFIFNYTIVPIKKKATNVIFFFLSFELHFKQMNVVACVPSVHWLSLKQNYN